MTRPNRGKRCTRRLSGLHCFSSRLGFPRQNSARERVAIGKHTRIQDVLAPAARTVPLGTGTCSHVWNRDLSAQPTALQHQNNAKVRVVTGKHTQTQDVRAPAARTAIPETVTCSHVWNQGRSLQPTATAALAAAPGRVCCVWMSEVHATQLPVKLRTPLRIYIATRLVVRIPVTGPLHWTVTLTISSKMTSVLAL